MRDRSTTPRPLEALPLPRRAINALRLGGIATLEEACDWSDDALLSLRHFGRAYLNALRVLAGQNQETEH